MGAPRAEFGAALRADVQIQVTLTRAFLVGQTEVTRAIWQSVGWALPAQLPNPNGDYGIPCEGSECPIANVSFFDAVSFANKYSEDRGLPPCYRLSGCTGEVGNQLVCSRVEVTAATSYACEGFRLPTEAEWEYAARAGTTTAFFNGCITPQPDFDCYPDAKLEAIGWYCQNSGRSAHPVAQKPPNGWGLHDTAGNVFELCNDIYDPSGYGAGPVVDPHGTLTPTSDLTATMERPFRILRGGAYLIWASAAKANGRTSSFDTDYAPTFGFRLARTVPNP